MANLSSRTTGLPFTVWVSPATGDRHVPRIKVEIAPEDRVPLAIGPPVRWLATPTHVVASRDLRRVATWIARNRTTLLRYWNSEIDTAELIADLR